MYVNKCIKCGAEFETKNPKRVICPNCLYSDKKYTEDLSNEAANASQNSSESSNGGSYSFGTGNSRDDRPYRNFDRHDRPQYNRDNQGRKYNNNRPNNRFQNGGNASGTYNNKFRNDNRPNGSRPQRPFGNRPNGMQRPHGNNAKPKRQKQLLVSKEQIEQIEILYKKALPLPNPDIHEVIGQAIQLEPRKVFFGINLVRQKLMLPKLPFPKRKLAVSPDQLFAIKNLYEPLLPLPPIGCHKIIAAQLRMDEWRVHVGIGLIRKQMGLDRWNQDRDDAPAEFKKTK